MLSAAKHLLFPLRVNCAKGLLVSLRTSLSATKTRPPSFRAKSRNLSAHRPPAQTRGVRSLGMPYQHCSGGGTAPQRIRVTDGGCGFEAQNPHPPYRTSNSAPGNRTRTPHSRSPRPKVNSGFRWPSCAVGHFERSREIPPPIIPHEVCPRKALTRYGLKMYPGNAVVELDSDKLLALLQELAALRPAVRRLDVRLRKLQKHLGLGSRRKITRGQVIEALTATQGNVTQAARLLQTHRIPCYKAVHSGKSLPAFLLHGKPGLSGRPARQSECGCEGAASPAGTSRPES